MAFQAPYSITDMARLQMAQQQQEDARQQAMMEGIGQGIQSLMGAYVENQAMTAKGKAYGDFLSKHGEQLGFNPEYLQDFLKKKPYEQAMIGDNIIGMQNAGNRLMSLNYMNQQANLFGGNRGTGTGAGGGGGGAGQPFMRVP